MQKSSPLKTILKTSLPAVIDLSSQTIMWTIEAIFIGRLSASAFAGHGVALQIILVFFSVMLTFVVGASLIINRHLGAKDYFQANHVFGQAMILGVLMAFLFAFIWYSGAIHIIGLIKEGESALAEEAGVTYIRTVALFAPLLITNFVAVGIIRSIGDTKYSMFVNVLINSINVVLSPMLIFGWFGFPRLEVKGAALAVGIAHSIGFVVTFFLLRSNKLQIFLSFKELTSPKWESFKKLFKTGLPTTMEQLAWALGMLAATIYAGQISLYILSTHQVFVRIQNVLSMVYMGFSLTAMSIMGQNLGASNNVLAEKMAKAAHRIMGVFVLIIVAIMMCCSKTLILVFNRDPQVLELGTKAIYIFAFAQIPKALNNVVSGNLRGIGHLQWLMWTTIIFVLIFEIGLNYFSAFVFGWGLYGIWGIQSLDESIRFSMNYWRFHGGSWRKAVS